MPVAGGRSGKLTAGGVLCILAGALGIIGGIVVGILAAGELSGAQVAGSVIMPIVLGLIAIQGGRYALKRERFVWAIAGGVCAFFLFILTLWYMYMIGVPLGIAAIVLIALSRKEFA